MGTIKLRKKKKKAYLIQSPDPIKVFFFCPILQMKLLLSTSKSDNTTAPVRILTGITSLDNSKYIQLRMQVLIPIPWKVHPQGWLYKGSTDA